MHTVKRLINISVKKPNILKSSFWKPGNPLLSECGLPNAEVSWENETCDNSEGSAVDVHTHNAAVLLSSLIESMLGCLETKREVTCALLSHTVLLSPYNASWNVHKSFEPIKMHEYCRMQNKNSTFLLDLTARKERPEHR